MRDYAWKIIRWPKTLNNKEGLENSIKTFSLALSKNGCFGQIIDARFVVSENHLSLAVANVLESQSRGLHLNLQPSTQLLMRLSGESQFASALKIGLNNNTTKAVIIIAGQNAQLTIDSFLREFKLKTLPTTFLITPELVSRIGFSRTPRSFASKKEYHDAVEKIVLNRVALALM